MTNKHKARTHPVVQTILCERVMLPAASDASSGHLRRCSDADTIKQSLSRAKDASILSWPPMMGQQKQ
eukprot:scaffold7687_cov112-Skeletonema_dohrnii-CCMP3373.AAC.2